MNAAQIEQIAEIIRESPLAVRDFRVGFILENAEALRSSINEAFAKNPDAFIGLYAVVEKVVDTKQVQEKIPIRDRHKFVSFDPQLGIEREDLKKIPICDLHKHFSFVPQLGPSTTRMVLAFMDGMDDGDYCKRVFPLLSTEPADVFAPENKKLLDWMLQKQYVDSHEFRTIRQQCDGKR